MTAKCGHIMQFHVIKTTISLLPTPSNLMYNIYTLLYKITTVVSSFMVVLPRKDFLSTLSDVAVELLEVASAAV